MKLQKHKEKDGSHYWLATCQGPIRPIVAEAQTRSEAFCKALLAIKEQGQLRVIH